MKVFSLLLFLLIVVTRTQAQQEPVLDTVAILEAQAALQEAEILYSKEHVNYAKAELLLSSLYMKDPNLAILWEDKALEALLKIRQKEGATSSLYQWALRQLPSPQNKLFESQLNLEEAEANKNSQPALYVQRLLERAKVFVEEDDWDAYELTTLAMKWLPRLAPSEQRKIRAYATTNIAPSRLAIASSQAAMDKALSTSTTDSLELANLLWQYGAAVLEQEKLTPGDYLDMDSVYLRLTQALGIYEEQLGVTSEAYQIAYQTLSPAMASYYQVEKPFFERLKNHQTNDDEFIVLFRQVLQQLQEDYVPVYGEDRLFKWTLRDIKQHHGVNSPYYQIVKSIKNNWELDDSEREIAIQKDLVKAYLEEYGKTGGPYLEALIQLGNQYAENGDDLLAEKVFHQAFDQLDILDEQGVLPPEGEGSLLEYYWATVLPTWRAVLIQEHNLNIIQQAYGYQSAPYWEAYFKLIYEHFQQNILALERGEAYLEKGVKNVPKEHLGVVLPWLEKLFKLSPEYHISSIVLTLPKVVPIPELESLLAYSLDSLQRQYSPVSTEVGKLLEVLADAYYYDTTLVDNAGIALARYQEILIMYQQVGDEDAYTELLDRVTQNITLFSPWTEEQVNIFFEELLKIKEEEEKDYEQYFLKYVERYASWLYTTEQLVASEQYFERIARFFERENPDYLTSDFHLETNDWYLLTLDKLASIYRKTGRYYKSLEVYRKLVRLAPVLSADQGEGIWRVIKATNDIGDLLYRAEDYDRALEAFDLTLRSLDLFKDDFPIFDKYQQVPSALLYVEALENKGQVLFDLEEVAEARLYYNKALDFVEEEKSPISLEETGSLMVQLAALAVYDYEDEKAEQYYSRALEVITDKEERSKIHLAFADYYQLIEQDSLAAFHFLEALSVDLKRVQQNYTALSEKERLLFLQPILKRFDAFFDFAIHYTNPDFLLEAFNAHLIVKGLSLETTNNLQSVCNVTENTLLRDKCLEMQNLREELSNSADLPLDVQYTLDARITELEKEIGLSSKDLRAIYDKNNRNLDFTDIKRLLYNMGTPDSLTMAIDFITIPETNEQGVRQPVYYAAIVIPRNPYPHFVRLATEEELADVLRIDVTAHSFNYITAPSESQYLYQLVWAPMLPYINKAQHLHICPTGLLSRIAFGTLHTGETTYKRIMDKWSIHYYGALRDMLHLKADNGPGKDASALLVGGVKFDLTEEELNALIANKPIANNTTPSPSLKVGARGEDFNFLIGSLEEVLAIGELFPEDNVVKLLSGARATEEKLTLFANEAPDILHIATHGYFFPTPPQNQPTQRTRKKKQGLEANIAASPNPLLRSGLALAGINRVWKGEKQIEGLEDGILTALEVSNLDLFNTKLVVLSACETGRGDIDNTEGILGLRRAFKIAGAQQLIISLWKVPDAQTSELMQLFYRSYLAGNSAHTAFENAQKEMSKRYKNPYYWAAFLLIE